MNRNACLAKDWHQLAFARQHRRLDVEGGAVGVTQQREQMVFGAAAIERRDQLQDANAPRRRRRISLFGEDRLHAALFYGADAACSAFLAAVSYVRCSFRDGRARYVLDL